MRTLTCVNKYREKNNRIFKYILKDSVGTLIAFEPNALKTEISTGRIKVTNLVLTKDNRLIDTKQKGFRISRYNGTIETYDRLERNIKLGVKQSEKQLRDRVENINYLEITDKNNNYIGFIYTDRIQELVDSIEKLYKKIKIKESSSIIANEVYYTCTIEGAKTTLKRTEQIISGVKPENYSEKMVQNSYNATKYLNIIRQGNYITEKELFKLWSILTKDACMNSEIQGNRYRTDDVQVGGYIAPEYNTVEWLMNQYFQFMYNDNDEIHPLIKSAILHFYFVFIHPFCDGNGRTARLLSTDYLIRKGLDKFKAISISKEIYNTSELYYNSIKNSENKYNDITFFIEYYLDIINITLQDIIIAIK
jgi:Fic family protein